VSNKDRVREELRQFGANFRRERTAWGVTQECLAELADLNVRTLQRIEAGETKILVTTLSRICEGLGCGSEALLGR
jgi:transcriptional regulator with XRE-family HTH domain